MDFNTIEEIIDREIYGKDLMGEECKKLNIPRDFVLAVVPHRTTRSKVEFVPQFNAKKSIIYISSTNSSGVKDDFQHEMRHVRDFYYGIVEDSSELSAYIYPFRRFFERLYHKMKSNLKRVIERVGHYQTRDNLY